MRSRRDRQTGTFSNTMFFLGLLLTYHCFNTILNPGAIYDLKFIS